MDISHKISLSLFFNIAGISGILVVTCGQQTHIVVKPAKLQCMPEAVSHTPSLFQDFPDKIFITYVIRHLSSISEYIYGLMDSIYRATLNRFNIKMYIIDICDHAHCTGLRSSGSRRVAWLNMQFVYYTAYSKPSTIMGSVDGSS